MFDSKNDFEGHMLFEPETAKIAKYFEEMFSEWVVVDPASMQNTQQDPSTIKLSSKMLYSLEKINSN